MSPPKLNPLLVAAFTAGLLYPPLVYFGISRLPPTVFVMIGVALIGMRVLGLKDSADSKIWRHAFLFSITALFGIMVLDAHLAVLAYPVVVSSSVSAVFSASLLFPPPLVERIARLSQPDLPPSGVIYTRRVTMVWAVVLFINALISLFTAIWGSVVQWTLWNGLLSYCLIGAVFICELGVRRLVQK